MNMPIARLKNLEIGYFRVKPSKDELRNICDFYNLPYAVMDEKAEKHCQDKALSKKIRTLKDG